MTTVEVKEVIYHPDGAVIVVPVDLNLSCFVMSPHLAAERPVKAGDLFEWDYGTE